jgi:DNA-binding MarR family transcriptional regulator
MTQLPEFLETSLNFNIYRTSLLLRREFSRALSGQGITPEQWQVMAVLGYTQKPVSQREIAALSLKDKHTISRIIAKMEKNGWIAKSDDSDDGRIRMIQLTEAGLLLAKKIPTILKKRFTGIRQTISLEEKQATLTTLKKLRAYLGDE